MKKTFLSFIKPKNDYEHIISNIVNRLEKLEFEGYEGQKKYLLTENESLKRDIINIEKNYPLKLNEGEELLSIFFKIEEEKKYYSLICKNTETFKTIKNRFYEKNPKYIDEKNYFIIKGKEILDESKTIEELGIKSNSPIRLKTKE